jgi:hypothetical protein
MNIVERQKLYKQLNWPKVMVNNSRANDKRAGRDTSSTDYITSTRIRDLMVLQDCKCFYCEVVMIYGNGVDRRRMKTAVTVERVDNHIEHLIGNCVLACRNCNLVRGDDFTFNEMSVYGMIKGSHKRCSVCKETIPRSNFHKSGTKEDGIETRCKSCRNEMNAQRNLERAVIEQDNDNEVDI